MISTPRERSANRDLDNVLIEAHRRRDVVALAVHYEVASDLAFATGETERGFFYLTHAWVFALEAGGPAADRLRDRLAGSGRGG